MLSLVRGFSGVLRKWAETDCRLNPERKGSCAERGRYRPNSRRVECAARFFPRPAPLDRRQLIKIRNCGYDVAGSFAHAPRHTMFSGGLSFAMNSLATPRFRSR